MIAKSFTHQLAIAFALGIAALTAASASNAQGAVFETCPTYYRFVDFGILGHDGAIYRGGPTFRAESLENRMLIEPAQTICRDGIETATDGHGNPIPIVTQVSYDPAKAGLAIEALRLSVVSDFSDHIDSLSAPHLKRLHSAEISTLRGDDYLCAFEPDATELSCQMVSPFGGVFAPVIYCSDQTCHLPALVVKEQIVAEATWARGDDRGTEAEAEEINQVLRRLYGFLSPLTS